MKRKPIVGETLWCVNINNAARGVESVAKPVVVVSVKNKYFKVTGNYSSDEFVNETWRQKTNYSADYEIWETEKEFNDYKLQGVLLSKFRILFSSYERGNIPLEKLIKINEILGE